MTMVERLYHLLQTITPEIVALQGNKSFDPECEGEPVVTITDPELRKAWACYAILEAQSRDALARKQDCPDVSPEFLAFVYDWFWREASLIHRELPFADDFVLCRDWKVERILEEDGDEQLGMPACLN